MGFPVPETWAGRGKQPRWPIAQLGSGKRIDDFRIRKAANGQVGADRRGDRMLASYIAGIEP